MVVVFASLAHALTVSWKVKLEAQPKEVELPTFAKVKDLKEHIAGLRKLSAKQIRVMAGGTALDDESSIRQIPEKERSPFIVVIDPKN